MSRRPTITPLAGDVLLAAASRILVNPTSNAQRVSLDEIVGFARALPALVEIADLAALNLAGEPSAADRLRRALRAAGFLPTDQETANG